MAAGEEEEWEVRSVMCSRVDSVRPGKAQRPTYARTETVGGFLVRLAGWGQPIPVSQPDPSKDTAPLLEETSKVSQAPAQPYDFSKPGGGVAAAKKSGEGAAAGEAAGLAKEAATEEGADTPPSATDTGTTDDTPRPSRLIKAELSRLKKVQGPYLNMDAFLGTDEERRSVEPGLALLDGTRARIPSSKEYYHASYVDGYTQPRQFLLAQAPTPKRLRAFWSLMLGHKVPLVVVLGSSSLPPAPFWPREEEDVSWEAGSLYVGRLGPVSRGPGYRLMHLRLRVDTAEERLQLMELNWEPELRVPMDLLGVVGRILALHSHSLSKAARQGLVEKGKGAGAGAGAGAGKAKSSAAATPSAPPVALVCRDGVGRCGTLAAAAIALERLMLTGEVELVETVKALRLQRFGALHHCLPFLQLHLLFLQHLGIQGKIQGKSQGLVPGHKPADVERLEAELGVHLRRLRESTPAPLAPALPPSTPHH